MRKFLLSFIVMLTGSVLLTGCLKDDDENKSTQTYLATQGAFIINNGNIYNGIDGSLTFLDFKTEPFGVTQNAFQSANGRSLGGTPNDVMVYGEKVYIAGSDENTVFVLNKKTFKLIDQISTTRSMGEAAGATPRALEGYDGKVFVSTYGGYVGVIDTAKMVITTKFQVGSAPEGMAVGGSDTEKFLYVANSDYGNGNGSISKISLKDGSVSEIKNEKIRNPQKVCVAGDVVYVLDWGYYTEDWSAQKEAGVYKISGSNVTLAVPDATDMTAAGYYIYTYNNPWGSTSIGYSKYNISTGALSDLFLSKKPESPCAISIEGNSGYLYIASRSMDADTGYPSYTTSGYVNVYDPSGNFKGSYPTGVEPHVIAFTYGMETVQF